MSDIYAVSIKLAMTGNATAFLGTLAQQVTGVHGLVKKLEKDLNGLSRIKLAIGGGVALAGGAALISTLKTITDHAKELSHELASLKTFNIDPAQLAKAQEVARATTRGVAGSTETGNLRLFRESYSIFGFNDAARMNPILSRFAQVMGGQTGNYKAAEESLYTMLKSGELMGKLTDPKTHDIDLGRLTHFLDTAAKVSAATGGKVNANTFFALAQQGGPALANMSDEGMISMLMAAQGMGGHRAGTALTSLYQQFVGGTMTKSRAEALKKLGLVGGFTVGRGGHLTFDPGALDTDFVKALGTDPLKADALMKQAMDARGVRGTEAQTKMLFEIIGRQTSQRLVSDFLRNAVQMEHERERIGHAQGADDQAQTRNTDDMITVEHNMKAAWENLMTAVAGPNASTSIGIMKELTTQLNSMTEAVRGMDPATLKAVGEGLLILGGALTAGGAAALIVAIGPAGWVVAGIVALALGFERLKPHLEGLVNWVDQKLGIAPDKMPGGGMTTGALVGKIAEAAKLSGPVGELAKSFRGSEGAYEAQKQRLEMDILKGTSRPVDQILREYGDATKGLAAETLKLGEATREAKEKVAEAVPPTKSFLESLAEAIAKVGQAAAAAEGGLAPIAYQSGGFGGLIHKASLGGGAANDNLGGMGGGGLYGGAARAGRGGGSGAITGPLQGEPTTGLRAEVRSYLRGAALARGIDPNVAERVFKQESGFNPYARNISGRERSYGVAQLNTMGGLGAVAQRRGIDPTDPTQWRRHLDFALDVVRKDGWRQWYGARDVGIGRWQGVGTVRPQTPTAGPPPRQREEQHIHNVYMDGERVHRSVERRMVAAARHPSSIGGMDTYGMPASPGTTLTDAA